MRPAGPVRSGGPAKWPPMRPVRGAPPALTTPARLPRSCTALSGGVRLRLELLHRVDRRTVRGVRLALDHDLHEHRAGGRTRLLAGPLDRVADLGGLEDPAAGAAVGLHHLDVVRAVVVVVD